MSYTKNPIVYPSGFVSVDTAKINRNFSILADAFVGNDPTTGIVKNADTVDGFHASHTPGPNVIVPLNAEGFLIHRVELKVMLWNFVLFAAKGF